MGDAHAPHGRVDPAVKKERHIRREAWASGQWICQGPSS
jgi:hypothetical protein